MSGRTGEAGAPAAGRAEEARSASGGAEGPAEGSAQGPGERASGMGAGRGDWRSLHLWEIQPLRDAAIVAAVIGVLYAGYVASVVTVPLLLSVLLAYLFDPLMRWMSERQGVRRRTGALVLIAGFAGVVVVPGVLGMSYGTAQLTAVVAEAVDQLERVNTAVSAARPGEGGRVAASGVSGEEAGVGGEAGGGEVGAGLSYEAAQLAVPEGTIWSWLRDTVRAAKERSAAGEPMSAVERTVSIGYEWARSRIGGERSLSESERRLLVEGAGEAARAVAGVTRDVVSLGFMAFLTAFFFYFVASGWAKLLSLARGLIPTAHASRVLELVTKFDRAVAGFVRGRLTVSFVQAGILTVGYAAIGTPAAFIVGPVVGLLALIPYASSIGIPAAWVLMLIDPAGGVRGEWWWIALSPVVLYALVQVIDDYVLMPTIVGQQTNMDTPTILFASLAGGAILGFYGLLVAIPLAACIKILVRELLWPAFKEWREGRKKDFLPFGGT